MRPQEESPRDRRVDLGLSALLFLAVLAVFGQSRGFEFLNYDDPSYVTENPPVTAGLSADGLRFAFGAFHSSNWHPLTWLSHMLDVQVFGMRPGPQHLVNVVLHGLAALSFFLFLARATGATGASFLAAGLFALHPLRAESVAWISERKDVLAGALFFLLLVAWGRYARAPGKLAYLAVVLVFTLGLLAKPMLVTAPCVLLLLDVWPLARTDVPLRTRVLEKVPLFVLAAGSALVTLLAQSAGGSVSSAEALPFGVRAANAAAAVLAYLRLTLIPTGLACFYPHPALVAGDPWRTLWMPAILGVLVLVVATAWSLGGARRAGPVAAGWLWFLGMLVPVIGLVQVGSQAYADRYTYLPHGGLFVALVFGARALLARRPALVGGAATLGTLVLLLFAGLAWRQTGTWRSSMSVSEHALAVTGANYVAHTNLGLALNAQGDFAGAEREFLAALRANPGFLEARFDLGIALANQGRRAEAESCFAAYLEKRPNDARALAQVALLHARSGDLGAARTELERVLELNPKDFAALCELARLELEAGAPARAAEYARRALALAPDSLTGLFLAGRAAEDQGDLRTALQRYQRARELAPQDAEAAFRQAGALAASGEYDAAEPLAEEAVRLDPSSPSALLLLSKLLFSTDTARARELLDRALALDPGNAGANGLLAIVEQQAGRADAAERAYRTALASDPDDTEARNNFAVFLDARGRQAEAAEQYEELLRAHADAPIAFLAARGLAWIRATSADPALRDGQAALRWASFARAGARQEDLAAYLDVLAAACAEAGKFDEALANAEAALGAAASPAQEKAIRARLELYRASRPYRRER
jgi:tetratricopeptide (TPR) repeat protein